jgi:hypothetical protein
VGLVRWGIRIWGNTMEKRHPDEGSNLGGLRITIRSGKGNPNVICPGVRHSRSVSGTNLANSLPRACREIKQILPDITEVNPRRKWSTYRTPKRPSHDHRDPVHARKDLMVRLKLPHKPDFHAVRLERAAAL